uniref:Uncharacterized protein n=1 Tax=Arthrobacter globiformis TaxID=1665 RepID=B8R4M3_ARTGO|nr:hypothetical protein [Arthrobacter globiformis]
MWIGYATGLPALAVRLILSRRQLRWAAESLDGGLSRGEYPLADTGALRESTDRRAAHPSGGGDIRRAKSHFVRDNDLVVWRLHDHMHRMSPEPVFSELLRVLGWSSSVTPEHGVHRLEIPPTRLDALAAQLQRDMRTQNVSVVGDPALLVRTVGFGAHGLSTVLPALHASDVAIVGETAEYDTYEYVRDAVALGLPKGLIRIAHERAEAWGVAGFADWVRVLAGDLRVESIETGDPFTVPVPQASSASTSWSKSRSASIPS